MKFINLNRSTLKASVGLNLTFVFLLLIIPMFVATARLYDYNDDEGVYSEPISNTAEFYYSKPIGRNRGSKNDVPMCGETSYFKFKNKLGQSYHGRPGQYPFMALNREYGAIIIDDRHLLTTGHMNESCRPSGHPSFEPLLFYGCHDAAICLAEKHLHLLSGFMSHENLTCGYNSVNDIALEKTREPIKFMLTKDGSNSVNSICLPTMNAKYEPGELVYILGWGAKHRELNNGTIRQQVSEMRLVDDEICKKIYSDSKGITLDMSKLICANVTSEENQPDCDFDFGGPLIGLGQSHRYELVGLWSFTGDKNCAYPSVFTRVSYYLNWIEESKKKPQLEAFVPPILKPNL